MDVAIDRCTLRIVRRGGWSWGAAPEALVRKVAAAIADAIERQLTTSAHAASDVEIANPVRVDVKLRAADLHMTAGDHLAADAFDGFDETPRGDVLRYRGSPASELQRRIDEALAAALVSAIANGERESAELPVEPAASLAAAPPGDHVVATALRRWHALGRLFELLGRLDGPTLERWYWAIRPSVLSEDVRVGQVITETVADAWHALVTRGAPIMVGHIAMATTSALRASRRLDDPEIWRAVVDVAGADERGARSVGSPMTVAGDRPPTSGHAPAAAASSQPVHETHSEADDADEAVTGSTARGRELPVPTAVPRPYPHGPRTLPPGTRLLVEPRREWEAHVESALPFLLLGPLAQSGWLATLAAVAEVDGWSAALPTVAIALAYKVLTPPRRGWQRADGAARSAAAFAGLGAAVAEGDVGAVARAVRGSLAPLEAVVSEALLAARRPTTPVVLARSESPSGRPWMVFDDDGLCPIAWSTSFDDAVTCLERCRPDPVLVVSGDEASTLRRLDGVGIRFLASGAPSRGERWRDVRVPGIGGCMTNDRTRSLPALKRLAARLPAARAAVLAIVESFGIERRSIPLAEDDGLERAVTHAALAALGTMAWALWGHREPVHPVLALERLHDLDAQVRVTANDVTVRVPLGRRHQDLYGARLLDDVTDVPWLGGRRVRFQAG